MSDAIHELAGNLRRTREARGFTISRLAMAADLNASTVATIESGRVRNPGVYTLYAVALALAVPLETLMGVSSLSERQRVRNHAASRDRETIRHLRHALDGWLKADPEDQAAHALLAILDR